MLAFPLTITTVQSSKLAMRFLRASPSTRVVVKRKEPRTVRRRLYASNIRAADANAAGQFIELYAILAVVLGGTSLMGGKFSIAGTVVGVLIIQTLDSTILFLGVPSAQSPVFFAIVVIVVVIIQSPRLHRVVRNLVRVARSRGTSESTNDVEVAG